MIIILKSIFIRKMEAIISLLILLPKLDFHNRVYNLAKKQDLLLQEIEYSCIVLVLMEFLLLMSMRLFWDNKLMQWLLPNKTNPHLEMYFQLRISMEVKIQLNLEIKLDSPACLETKKYVPYYLVVSAKFTCQSYEKLQV